MDFDFRLVCYLIVYIYSLLPFHIITYPLILSKRGTAFSIFESLDDEDYFEPPLVHLDDQPHPTVRSPQSVIPRVRDPNGQLVDAQLEVVTYQKPLTPRDEDDLSRAVTICGTRRRSPKSKREGTYLLTEEEPSPEEQAARRIKAEVTKKPLWERTWGRYERDRGGYVFDKQGKVYTCTVGVIMIISYDDMYKTGAVAK